MAVHLTVIITTIGVIQLNPLVIILGLASFAVSLIGHKIEGSRYLEPEDKQNMLWAIRQAFTFTANVYTGK